MEMGFRWWEKHMNNFPKLKRWISKNRCSKVDKLHWSATVAGHQGRVMNLFIEIFEEFVTSMEVFTIWQWHENFFMIVYVHLELWLLFF